jgi:hypothetical protein
MTEQGRLASLVDTGIVPVAPTSDDCSLFDCPDDRFDPIEQFSDQLVLSVS